MYEKSSVKLLPIIENTNNKVSFYSEFDGGFEVGDKLYIAVNNTNIVEYYALDSLINTGYTNDLIGYELLNKIDNKLTLDIEYDTFSLTGLTEGTCFIGRVYIRNSIINRGVINGSLIKDTSTQPLTKSNIEWKQGILFDTLGEIRNINFNTKSSGDKLLLKSIVNTDGVVETFYTQNNNGIGLSIINLSQNRFSLVECNINAGVFNNCDLTGYKNTITGGELYGCNIGDNYIVNGGRLVNCVENSSLVDWINGSWYSDWTDGDPGGNPFKSLIWYNGIWEYGEFPSTSTWNSGRFKSGLFEGLSWITGTFNSGTFKDTIWEDGIFNDGTMINSTWNDGVFNNGTMVDTLWEDGTFNNGSISSTSTQQSWNNGIFNGGEMVNMEWDNGTFNDGTISGCTWNDGIFNGGIIRGGSIWYNGTFYNGEFSNSRWDNGTFHNGIMRNSKWLDGVVYYGVFIDMNNFPNKYWDDGIWYNGTMNNVAVRSIEFYNGIVNDSQFGVSSGSVINWYDGSWNSGTFGGNGSTSNWYDGTFYFGTFSGTTWENGTFYKGDIQTSINDRYILDKEFTPFKRSGLYIKKSILNKDRINRANKRLPRKRRF